MSLIYKLVGEEEWRRAAALGVYAGSEDDRRDGFIHFSDATQVEATATKWFAGRDDLVLLGIDPQALGAALRYEPSRGGQLFPHLYGELPLSAVVWTRALPLGKDGRHQFSALEP